MNTVRKSALILAALVFLIYLPGPIEKAAAHAVVTASSLKERPVKAKTPTVVALFFNSNIELALSNVFLVSEGDIERPLSFQAGKKPGAIKVILPVLAAGNYALHYKVYAADGHLTEDVIHFEVAEGQD